MSRLFAVGGYAEYVWPAYSVSLLCLGYLTLLARKRMVHTRRRLASQSSRLK